LRIILGHKQIIIMKKLVLFLFGAVALNSCISKVVDPLSGCGTFAEKYTTAYTEFINDYTNVKKCENFIDVTKSYLKSCGILTAAQKKELEDAYKDIDCKSVGN
jgi:hypothetical protein